MIFRPRLRPVANTGKKPCKEGGADAKYLGIQRYRFYWLHELPRRGATTD